MEIHERIRIMREVNQLTQEDMAEKLAISTNGYAKIERGQTALTLNRLEQIANIFNISVNDLLNDEKAPTWYFKENHSQNIHANYYASDNSIILELEKLKLTIEHYQQTLLHKDELLTQKDNEIATLRAMIELLKKGG